jgi:HEAT repeat protein
MKSRFFPFFLLALNLAAAGLFTGCKDKQPSVDVSAQVQALKGTDTDARVNALTELAKAGPDAAPAVPDLIPVLKDNDALVRRLAAYTLGQIGPKASAALPAIREALNDSDPEVVKNAVIAVRFIDPTAPKEQIQNVATP